MPPPLFPGDDLVAASERPRGVPIGNLTSQLWGNFYLDELDHWITEAERHGAYLSTPTTFCSLAMTRERLWELRRGIVEQLACVRLKLAEPKSRLLATREACRFAASVFCLTCGPVFWERRNGGLSNGGTLCIEVKALLEN